MASRRVHDDYLELVKQFPLRPLRTEAEYQDANRLHRSLIGRADVGELSSGQLDYVEALIRFIQDWDHRHYKPSSPLKTPLARLRYLMAQNEMRTTDLGRLVGGRAQASLILHGKRELSKANIRTLAERFRVSPALFL